MQTCVQGSSPVPAAKLNEESLQSAEQMAILRRQGCSAGRSTGCPWPQYKLPSGAYVFPAYTVAVSHQCSTLQITGTDTHSGRLTKSMCETVLFFIGRMAAQDEYHPTLRDGSHDRSRSK